MAEILISVFARTDKGLRRGDNEDAFLVADLSTGTTGLSPEVSSHRIRERGSLLAISDGMGGASAGEIASELTVTTLFETLKYLPITLEASERLSIATDIANERIWNQAQQRTELRGMGATLTAVLVTDDIASIVQVGDSRAYLIRRGRIKQLTRDQSMAQMLAETGGVESEDVSPAAHNVIMQALGTQLSVQLALDSVQLYQNDYLLLCSDGLSNKISATEMREMIYRQTTPEQSCRKLVELANKRGGEDNITVVIAHFSGPGLAVSPNHPASITASVKRLREFCFNPGR